jgi:hypothetical protein
MPAQEPSPITPAKRIANHWYDRSGWEPGRLFDTWHLVFDEPQVRNLVARCRIAVSELPGLNLVTDEWLHMTIQGVGWSDELTDAQRRAVVQCATEGMSDMREREIQLGPPIVKGEALVLPAMPTGFLQRIRNRLRSAIEEALGQPAWNAAEQAHGFQPHLSFAYARCDRDATPYTAALDEVSPASVQIPVREIALIRQDRQLGPHWRYVWNELARIPLATGG